MNNQSPHFLRLIAAFKLVKAALLINSGGHFISEAIEKASALTPEKIKLLSAASLVYAGLFLTEGIGLWLLKRWAEWFTIIITSSLVPLELYEIHRHPTPLKFAVLAINIVIVIYLIARVRQNPSK